VTFRQKCNERTDNATTGNSLRRGERDFAAIFIRLAFAARSASENEEMENQVKKKTDEERLTARASESGVQTVRPIQSRPPSIAASLFQLQRTRGNRFTQQLLRSRVIQAKLTVSQPDDEYEHEADYVADQVMRMPEGKIEAAGRDADITPLPRIQRLCPACGEEEGLRRQPQGEAEERLRGKADDQAGGEVDSSVESAIESMRGNGQPLSQTAQNFFEPRFGYDFSRVRIHADSQGDGLARSLQARAFTVGSDVVFRAGEYAPETNEGRKLLAHELTHVAQQSGQAATQVALARRPQEGLIQRFESPEHIELGDQAGGGTGGYIVLSCHNRDLPQRRQPVETWPPAWRELWQHATIEQRRAITDGLTYGEVVAFSGDIYDSFAALDSAPLRDVIKLIPLIRSHTTTTAQFQQATAGRYLDMAAKNESHFSNVAPGHRNRDVWRRIHIDAIQAARQGNDNLAWGLNANADHYLTDAYSGGHIRTPRSQLMGSNLGNIESKILHDLDNTYGVDVTNDRGDTWTAYGDNFLADPRNTRNRALAMEAVRLSKQDIEDARAQRTNYPDPVKRMTPFPAEALIPRPVNTNKDRWIGRTPTYHMGPGDVPIRGVDDYTKMRDQVILHEGPGVVSGFLNDDDEVREWVRDNSQAGNLDALGRQPAPEKIRMINTLIGGFFSVISEEDMATIETILRSVKTADEMRVLRAALEPRANSFDFGKRERFRLALSRNP